MRNFKAIFVAICAMVVIANSAWAGDIDNETAFDGGTALTVAQEGAAALTGNDYDLDGDVTSPLGNATGSAILYQPGVSFNAGDTIRFELTNGTFEDAALFMAIDEADTDGAGAASDLDADAAISEYQIVGQESDRAADDTWVEITVVAVGGNTWQPTWEMALISSNADADTGADPAVELDAAAYDNNLKIRPINTTSDVSIAVTSATYSGGNTTDDFVILEMREQFDIAVTTQATSVIDVNANITTFVEEGGADDADDSTEDTDAGVVPRSAAQLTFVDNVAAIDDSITLDAADSLTLTINAQDFSGLYDNDADGNVDGLIVNVDQASQDDPTAWNANQRFDYTAGDTSATISLTIAADNPATPSQLLGNASTIDIVLECTGNDTLATRTFNMDATLNLATEGDVALMSGSTSHTWGINGAQFFAPHLFSRDGWESYLVFKTATGAIASEIFVDLCTTDGATKVSLDQNDVAALALAADGAKATISAGDLLNAAGLAYGPINGVSANDFSALFTVTLPQQQVYVDGFKYGGGATYLTSVYENKTAAESDDGAGNVTTTTEWSK